jgi:hypothetical protein
MMGRKTYDVGPDLPTGDGVHGDHGCGIREMTMARRTAESHAMGWRMKFVVGVPVRRSCQPYHLLGVTISYRGIPSAHFCPRYHSIIFSIIAFIQKMGGTTSKEASQNESNLKSPPASLTAITEDPNARHVQEKREKLPSDLQKLVDNEDSFLDQLYEGTYVLLAYISPNLLRFSAFHQL